MQTDRQTDRQAGRQAGRRDGNGQIERQTDKLADRQMGTRTSGLASPCVPDSQWRSYMAGEEEVPSGTGHVRVQAPVVNAVALNHVQACSGIKHTQGCCFGCRSVATQARDC